MVLYVIRIRKPINGSNTGLSKPRERDPKRPSTPVSSPPETKSQSDFVILHEEKHLEVRRRCGPHPRPRAGGSVASPAGLPRPPDPFPHGGGAGRHILHSPAHSPSPSHPI